MQPTYQQTYEDAKGHGKAFLQSTIGAHPGTTAMVMGGLIVLVLVFAYYAYANKGAGHFQVAPVNNMTTGNNNPLWQHGNMDAGNWGPVHREATSWNVAAYHPDWRAGGTRPAGGAREGLGNRGPCGPGEVALVVQGPNGTTATYCRSTSDLPGPPAVCGRGWDPAASAEAEALATVGSLPHRSYGEGRLDSAVDAAFDSGHGLSDDQLTTLMHEGGTP